jgi:large subunit ribosomal protein L15
VKLHDLSPAPGSTKRRTRVGRGIAAGKGKTAGRGTKGQKARAGASIPGWFEGGQTPIHVRVPKLRGFKRRGRIEYQVVNVGRIAEYAAAGRFGEEPGKDPLTVNGEVLAGAGLVSHADRPVKVLGHGDIDVRVFVAADAFTASARQKIEAAGGFVQTLTPEPATQATPASTAPNEVGPISGPATSAAKRRGRGGAAMAAQEAAPGDEAPGDAIDGMIADVAAQPEATADTGTGPDASADSTASVDATAATDATVEVDGAQADGAQADDTDATTE